MNEKAEKLIRTVFDIYGKPKTWTDALVSDWEWYFNWAGISAEGDAQFDYFFEHCYSATREGRAIKVDPPKSRPIGE